jgi:hypothetical protein
VSPKLAPCVVGRSLREVNCNRRAMRKDVVCARATSAHKTSACRGRVENNATLRLYSHHFLRGVHELIVFLELHTWLFSSRFLW